MKTTAGTGSFVWRNSRKLTQQDLLEEELNPVLNRTNFMNPCQHSMSGSPRMFIQDIGNEIYDELIKS